MRTDPESKSCDYKSPQTLNRYAYVWNEPINNSDPLGLRCEPPCYIQGEDGPCECPPSPEVPNIFNAAFAVIVGGVRRPPPRLDPVEPARRGGSCSVSTSSGSGPASSDSEWKVYDCSRPLGKPGSAKKCLDPTGYGCHEFLCLSENGWMNCVGLNPSGSKFGSPGMNNPADSYHAENCNEVASDACMGRCVRRKFRAFNDHAPYYHYSPPASYDCHDWAQDTLKECLKECPS